MKEQKILAARLVAGRLTEINAELDRELMSAAPDWERVERLSAEAAAYLNAEAQAEENEKALLAALPAAAPSKRKIQPMRWFRFAAAAAIAGIALFAVPAAIRHNHSIRKEPAVTDSITTETTAATDITTVTSALSALSAQTNTVISSSETVLTGSTESFTEAGTTTVPRSTGSQAAVTTTASVTTQTEPPQTGTSATASTQSSVTVTSSTSVSESVTGDSTAVQPGDSTAVHSETAASSETVWKSGGRSSARINRALSKSQPVTVLLVIVDEQNAGGTVQETPIIGEELMISTSDGECICSWVYDGSPKEIQLNTSRFYRLSAVSVPAGCQNPIRSINFSSPNSPSDEPVILSIPLKRSSAGEGGAVS